MCFHDGPGIRTTVFLQGCSIHCPWCCNPETQMIWQNSRQEMQHYEYDTIDLANILLKDRFYWDEGGGVTFSGGEPLLQAAGMVDVCTAFAEKPHIAVETSLFVEKERIKVLLPYVDYWYIDIKILDGNQAIKVLGGNIEQYYENVNLLEENNCDVHFRIPCSKEYTIKPQNWKEIIAFLRKHTKYPVELFSVHNLAEKKYRKMGADYRGFELLDHDTMELLAENLSAEGIVTSIIEI